jgi:hypothetical protein
VSSSCCKLVDLRNGHRDEVADAQLALFSIRICSSCLVEGGKPRVGWRAVDGSAIIGRSDTRLGRKKPRLFRLPLLSYAAGVSHDVNNLNLAASGDYSGVLTAIPFAQRLQAGLYATFLTDVGQPPIHMSAMMPSLALLM